MKRLLFVFAVMSIHGCAFLFGQPPGSNFDAGTGAVPHFADGGLAAGHPECAGLKENVAVHSLLRLSREPAVSDGVVETPVSPSGCIYLREEYRGGRRVAVSVHKRLGFLRVVDEASQLYEEAEAVLMSATFDADRSMHATFDSDGDGRVDARVDELRADGVLRSRTTTEFDDTTGSVVRRETMTVLDANRMHFKVEELVSGELTTVREFEAPSLQK
jgi:hypothetical protein